MIFFIKNKLLFFILLILINITSCGTILPKIKSLTATVSIEPAISTNLDAGGIQRPVNIKIYYLKDDVLFLNGTFANVFHQSENYLNSDIVNIKSYQVIPSKNIILKEKIDKEVKYIGVAAAFININKNDWKSIIKKPKKCLTCIKKIKKPIRIILNNSTASLSSKKP